MVKLFDMDFFEGTMYDAVEDVVQHAKHGTTFEVVVTPNSDHSVRLAELAKTDSAFATKYKETKWHFADGMPLVLASKLMGTPLTGRITGADFLPALLKAAEAEGLNVGILGADDSLLQDFIIYCSTAYPNIHITAMAAPVNFHPEGEEGHQCAKAFTNCDILLAGVGFPKQERWLFAYGSSTPAKVGVAIGAALEFLCEKKQRAPKWMQDTGLEFVHRWASEPKRLTGRYVRDFAIIPMILKERFKR